MMKPGLVGDIKSIVGNVIAVKVISSRIFEFKDEIFLNCVDYTIFKHGDKEISIEDLKVGDRVCAKYISSNINREYMEINEILSIELIDKR